MINRINILLLIYTLRNTRNAQRNQKNEWQKSWQYQKKGLPLQTQYNNKVYEACEDIVDA